MTRAPYVTASHRLRRILRAAHDAVLAAHDRVLVRLQPGELAAFRAQARSRGDHARPVERALVDGRAQRDVAETARVAEVPHRGDAGLEKGAGPRRAAERPERGPLQHHGLHALHGESGPRLLEVEQLGVRIDEARRHRVRAQVDPARACRCLHLLGNGFDAVPPDEDLARAEQRSGNGVEHVPGPDHGHARVWWRLRGRGSARPGDEGRGQQQRPHLPMPASPYGGSPY
jgi:hypothetical protein